MKESWQRNLIVLWFGTFMTGIVQALSPLLYHFTSVHLAITQKRN